MRCLTLADAPAAPVMLQRHRVQDIDTPEDWERAQLMFAVMRQQDNS